MVEAQLAPNDVRMSSTNSLHKRAEEATNTLKAKALGPENIPQIILKHLGAYSSK